MGNGKYWACDDRNLVDVSCCLLLEQLFDNETTDVACAYDGEILEARHGLVYRWGGELDSFVVTVGKVVGIYTVSWGTT